MKSLKAKIISVLMLLCAPVAAFADDSSSAAAFSQYGLNEALRLYLVQNGIVMKNNNYLSFANATPGSTKIPAIKLDATNNLQVNAISGKVVKLAVAGTPKVNVDADGLILNAGFGYNLGTGYVPTLAATPVATTGANEFKPGLNIVPTHAANVAGFLGPKTPVPGQAFVVKNTAGASIRIKAAGGATMNGATAGGFIDLANLATAFCQTTSVSNQDCQLPAAPTAQ